MASLTKDNRECVIQAWYIDDSDDNEKLPHHRCPKEFVSLQKLEGKNVLQEAVLYELGVLTWKLDADNYECDPELKKICETRGYTNREFYDIHPEKMTNYEEMLKIFYQEHFHSIEEVSLCISGSGYYDVRDWNEAWIRVWLKKGGMIALPAGIYHRVTVDLNNCLMIMTFNAEDSIITAYNRSHDHHFIRKQYVETLVDKMGSCISVSK